MKALKWLLILLGLLMILGGGLLGLCGVAFRSHGDPTAAIGFILAIVGVVLVVAMASRGQGRSASESDSAADGEGRS